MTKEKRRFKMFTAGPVNVSESVKTSMIYPEMGHREPEFEALYSQIRQKLPYAFNTTEKLHSTVVIGGSGTAGMESVLSSVVHDGRSVFVINNGAFGDRMAQICDIYRIPVLRAGYSWGQYPDLKKIEETISENKEIEVIAMPLLETSTGMLNPVNDVGEIAKKYGKKFVVDAVSGLAGDSFSVEDAKVDFCFSNTNKGLSGLPALSFVCAKNHSLEEISDIKPRNMYLNLQAHYKYAKENQTPFTPQIPLFFMLNQSLDELIHEGLSERNHRYQENSSLMRSRLREMGFQFQLPEKYMSNVMTNVLLPENYEYEEFHTPLKQEGYIIYPGKGPLEGKVLHIANVGTHTAKDVNEFCDQVEKIVHGKKPKY